jgi:hypothetical protein
MFLVRTIFWLSLVIALIPANPSDLTEGQRPVSTFETLSAAETFVRDLSGFCERNASACDTGRQIVAQFGAKAHTGLSYLSAYIEKKTPPPSRTATDGEDNVKTGAID